MSWQKSIWASRTPGVPPAPLRLEEGGGRTYLSVRSDAGPIEWEHGVDLLYQLHLDFHVGGIPHRVEVGRTPDGRWYVDGINMGCHEARARLAFAYDAVMADAPLVAH